MHSTCGVGLELYSQESLKGRVAIEKAGEKHISFEKVLPPPLQVLE